jgi:tRNA-guanine family transglycosylase
MRAAQISGGQRRATCGRWASMGSASAAREKGEAGHDRALGVRRVVRGHAAAHLHGISEPDDLFTVIVNGTFDWVSPSRVARNGTLYREAGRINITSNARLQRDFSPLDPVCDCYTCATHPRAYVHVLFRVKQMLSATLATLHSPP